MANQSNILVWKIPWTEEPGGLQSMRSQIDMTEHACTGERACARVHTHTHTHTCNPKF